MLFTRQVRLSHYVGRRSVEANTISLQESSVFSDTVKHEEHANHSI